MKYGCLIVSHTLRWPSRGLKPRSLRLGGRPSVCEDRRGQLVGVLPGLGQEWALERAEIGRTLTLRMSASLKKSLLACVPRSMSARPTWKYFLTSLLRSSSAPVSCACESSACRLAREERERGTHLVLVDGLGDDLDALGGRQVDLGRQALCLLADEVVPACTPASVPNRSSA